MKRRSLITLLVALALILSAGAPALAEDTIKIGGIGVLSGDYGFYGQAVQEGVNLYVKQVNAAGGVLGKQVEILWEDTQADASVAINAYYKLTEQDGIVGFVGGVLTGETKAIAEVSAEDGIPQITASATAYDVTTNRPNVFRTCFLDPTQGIGIANYVAEIGVKKAAILYDNADDYSKGLSEAFKAKAEELGIQIVAEEVGAYKAKDYRTQLTTIQAAAPEAVFLPYYGSDAALILAQAKEIGLDVKFYGGDGISDINVNIADMSLLANMVYTDHFTNEVPGEVVTRFLTDYKAEYGKEPSIAFTATGYDAALVLLSAIQAAGTTEKEAVVAAIKNSSVTGVTGPIAFDDHNDPIKNVFILTFDAQGNKVFVKEVEL